jgi:hypothetical protein
MLESGNKQHLLITLGVRKDDDRTVCDLFCADFKVGTDAHAVVMDASILASLLFQHGYRPAELVAKLTQPSSIIGTMIRAAARFEEENAPATPAKSA